MTPRSAKTLSVRPVGDRACIVDLPDLASVLGVAAILRERAFAGVTDVVPAARTVLVVCVDRASRRRVADELAALPAGIAKFGGALIGESARAVAVEVVYDGEDLDAVGRATGLGAAGVVAAHTGGVWTAAFGGFAPGFVYLSGGDPALEVPRLEAPRTRVPAGSVALAGPFSAVYPGDSPGGWRLIGRTEARLWDVDREPAALVQPGDAVRFVAVQERIDVPRRCAEPEPAGTPDASDTGSGLRGLRALDPGVQTLLQDAGRPGFRAIGVSPSGAADRSALRRANRAVGNPEAAAVLETLNAALALRAESDVVIALAGTDASAEITRLDGTVDRIASEVGSASLAAGETLRVQHPERGLRGVLAVRGGFAAPPTLGSLSRDTLASLGPRPVAAGDVLLVAPVGDPVSPQTGSNAHAAEPGAELAGPPPEGEVTLRFVPGPRADWFDSHAMAAFTAGEWAVTPQSSRVGLRLDGPPLRRARTDELPSEGIVRGSIQVPPNGLPVLLLADHPVTGGYPVIGTVVDRDTDVAAQLRPGDRVRFAPVAPDDALDALSASEPTAASRSAASAPHERSPIDSAPIRVRATLEVDGRRVAVDLPVALAAALDRLAAAADRSRGSGPEAAALAAFLGSALAVERPASR